MSSGFDPVPSDRLEVTSEVGAALTDFDYRIAASLLKLTHALRLPKDTLGYLVDYLSLNQPMVPISQVSGWRTARRHVAAYGVNVTVTATTEATAQELVALPSIGFDGTTVQWLEFNAPFIRSPAAGVPIIIILREDGSAIGNLGQVYSPAGSIDAPMHSSLNPTPTVGPHVYSAAAYVGSGTGIVFGGVGGAGNNFPILLSIVADQ